MLVIQDAYNAGDLPRGGIAAIGNFDGVHRGQRAVLDQVVQRAAEAGTASLVITFEPHPLALLRPDEAPPRLTPEPRKERLLADAGVEVTLVVAFTAELARTPAETFVRDFLHRRLGLRELYVGAGFVFGHRREGNLQLLQRLGGELGFSADAVEEVTLRGERISSTRVRRALAEGRVEEAAEMLGRPHDIRGTVVRGDRMGQRLGWPTANIATVGELVPHHGVYATRLSFPAFPATFDSVTNIGTRPTVYENYQQVVESHVLDFNSDVYGQEVELSFYKRLREERIFQTVMDLSAQIGRDVEATREFFAVRRRLEEGGTLPGLATP
jgi:riboflavin kinase/FMN adenylyltransferase